MVNKKILIFAAITALVIGLFVFAIIFFNNPPGKRPGLESSIIPTINQKNPKTTQTFYDMDIVVPENWSFERDSFPGGESFVIRPKSNPPGSYFPSIIIQRYPKEEYENLQRRVASYFNSGLALFNVSINGEEVKGVQGKNPFKVTINGEETSFFSTIFVYQVSDSAYYFESKYAGEERNTELEKIFNTIISSFKFNP